MKERGEGSRLELNKADFFRVWLNYEGAAEDKHAKRRRIAQAEKAEYDAELARIDVDKMRGELFHAQEIEEIFVKRGQKIREGLEIGRRLATGKEAVQLISEKLEEVDAETLATYGVSGVSAEPQNGKATP